MHVRYPKSTPDKVFIEFDYRHEPVTNKRFSFLRPKSEILADFLKRLKIKMNIELEKKLQRKVNRLEKNYDLTNIIQTVSFLSGNNCENFLNLSLEDTLTDTSVLRINENDYSVAVNFPFIESLKLPKVIMAECPVVPKISMEFGCISDLEFIWSVTDGKNKWEVVSTDMIYSPKSDQVNRLIRLKVFCPKSNQSFQYESPNAILECPEQKFLEMRWEYLENCEKKNNQFRIMSYNVLAKTYSDSVTAKEIFRHCPVKYLSMDYRKGLLAREIIKYRSDIICLQEVDLNLFDNFLQPFFSSNGFGGIFLLKDIDALEGQSIFWNQSKFEIVQNISIQSLSKLVLDDQQIDFNPLKKLIIQSPDILDSWIKLKQVMVGCVLRSINQDCQASSNLLIVANTHLYFHPKADLIRLFQTAAIVTHLNAVKRQYSVDVPVVFLGDFNSSRNSESIRYLLDQSVSLNDSNTSLGHDFQFLSAYNAAFTNYIIDFSAELDYIFYDSRGLSCIRTIPLPSVEDVTVHQALPNQSFPSDHLALVTDLEFI